MNAKMAYFVSISLSVFLCVILSIMSLFLRFDNSPESLEVFRGLFSIIFSPVISSIISMLLLRKMIKGRISNNKIIASFFIFLTINFIFVILILFVFIGGPPS